MSAEAFPSLPGLSIEISRVGLWQTRIVSSDSRVEHRATRWAYPRHRYKLKFNFLRPLNHNSLTDEVATLTAFFVARAGAMDSFVISDPVDGVSRRVRFDENLSLEQFLSAVWESQSVELISLLDEPDAGGVVGPYESDLWGAE